MSETITINDIRKQPDTFRCYKCRQFKSYSDLCSTSDITGWKKQFCFECEYKNIANKYAFDYLRSELLKPYSFKITTEMIIEIFGCNEQWAIGRFKQLCKLYLSSVEEIETNLYQVTKYK